MSIILEGPDCAGKSTMAKDLADALGFDIIKSHKNGPKNTDAYRERLTCHNVVIDRCWISELIYAKYFGKTPIVDDFEDGLLCEVCMRRHIPIVVMLPSLEVLERRMSERGDDYYNVVAPNLASICKDYEDYAKTHRGVTVVRDYNPQELINCLFSARM